MFIGIHADMAIRNYTLFQYISHVRKNAMLYDSIYMFPARIAIVQNLT